MRVPFFALPRTAFIPTANGPLHLGHALVCLANYWWAQKLGGEMVLVLDVVRVPRLGMAVKEDVALLTGATVPTVVMMDPGPLCRVESWLLPQLYACQCRSAYTDPDPCRDLGLGWIEGHFARARCNGLWVGHVQDGHVVYENPPMHAKGLHLAGINHVFRGGDLVAWNGTMANACEAMGILPSPDLRCTPMLMTAPGQKLSTSEGAEPLAHLLTKYGVWRVREICWRLLQPGRVAPGTMAGMAAAFDPDRVPLGEASYAAAVQLMARIGYQEGVGPSA
jgi:hypothetical protein